jgi:hypothetical protein
MIIAPALTTNAYQEFTSRGTCIDDAHAEQAVEHDQNTLQPQQTAFHGAQ